MDSATPSISDRPAPRYFRDQARIACCSLRPACESPSASKTWEGSTAPLEQADPLDTQKPLQIQRNDERLSLYAVKAADLSYSALCLRLSR